MRVFLNDLLVMRHVTHILWVHNHAGTIYTRLVNIAGGYLIPTNIRGDLVEVANVEILISFCTRGDQSTQKSHLTNKSKVQKLSINQVFKLDSPPFCWGCWVFSFFLLGRGDMNYITNYQVWAKLLKFPWDAYIIGIVWL